MPSFSWIPALVLSSFVLQSINAHEPESNPFPLEPCNGVVIKDVTVAVLQEVQTHPIARTNNQIADDEISTSGTDNSQPSN